MFSPCALTIKVASPVPVLMDSPEMDSTVQVNQPVSDLFTLSSRSDDNLLYRCIMYIDDR